MIFVWICFARQNKVLVRAIQRTNAVQNCEDVGDRIDHRLAHDPEQHHALLGRQRGMKRKRALPIGIAGTVDRRRGKQVFVDRRVLLNDGIPELGSKVFGFHGKLFPNARIKIFVKLDQLLEFRVRNIGINSPEFHDVTSDQHHARS
ncbi:MAG: hypothetical protein ACREIA_07180 [Opitutaceae bacterium]